MAGPNGEVAGDTGGTLARVHHQLHEHTNESVERPPDDGRKSGTREHVDGAGVNGSPAERTMASLAPARCICQKGGRRWHGEPLQTGTTQATQSAWRSLFAQAFLFFLGYLS